MQKILYAFLALCLFYTAYSQAAVTCPDGQFVSPGNVDPAKGSCSMCLPWCVTCTSSSGCTTFIDRLKGVDRAPATQVVLCAAQGASALPANIGYNKANDQCDRCADGCDSCVVDYDLCAACKEGWDFDRNNFQCIRATLGLAAVVLALSALTLIVVVITCICACKL